MKKFGLLILSCFCLAFLGVSLMGCDKAAPRTISVEADASLVDVKLKVDQQEVKAGENGSYVVDNFANVKVELYSNDYAVDFSNTQITVNGSEYNLIKDSAYNPLRDKANQYVGRFLLGRVDSNINIVISGVARAKSTFNFSATNLDNPEVVQKLKVTQINATDDNTYVNLYDFITGEDATVTREINRNSGSDNKFKTFNIKFDKTNLFGVTKNAVNIGTTTLNGNTIKVMRQNGVGTIATATWAEDHFVVNMGEIGLENEYDIIFDFDALQYQTYTFNTPARCLAYAVSAPDTNFNQDTYITISKLHNATNLNDVRVILDGKALTEKQIDENGNVSFKVAKGTTPNTSSDIFNSQFVVEIKGVTYTQLLHNLTFAENTFNGTVGTVDNGTVAPFAYGEDGVQQTLAGNTVQFAWSNPYIDGVGYSNQYVLNDYNVMLNGTLLFNLAARLTSASIGEDLTTLETLIVDINKDITLEADYNQTTKQFDTFRLNILCNEDLNLAFEDLKEFSKKICVTHAVSSAPLTQNVQYKVLAQDQDVWMDEEWIEVETQSHDVSVAAGTRVAFMLTIAGDVPLGENAFTIQNKNLFSQKDFTVQYTDNGLVRSVYIFTISDIQWQQEEEFMLIAAN